jgi:hypothetical protein
MHEALDSIPSNTKKKKKEKERKKMKIKGYSIIQTERMQTKLSSKATGSHLKQQEHGGHLEWLKHQTTTQGWQERNGIEEKEGHNGARGRFGNKAVPQTMLNTGVGTGSAPTHPSSTLLSTVSAPASSCLPSLKISFERTENPFAA